MAYLHDTASGRRFSLHAATTIIGRDPTCAIRVIGTQVSAPARSHRAGGRGVLCRRPGQRQRHPRQRSAHPRTDTLRDSDSIEVPGLTIIFQDEQAKTLASAPEFDRTLITSALDLEAGLRIGVAPRRS